MTWPTGNLLLDALPLAEGARIAAKLVSTPLKVGDRTPAGPGRDATVDFPLDAIVSGIVTVGDGRDAEILSFGREGIVVVDAAVMPELRRRETACQVPGIVLRMSLSDFEAELIASPAFALLTRRAIASRLHITEQLIACNRLHTVRQRAARFLLLYDFRRSGSHIRISQQRIAKTIGVRRASLTVALGVLAVKGAVTVQRGFVTIRDVSLLRDEVCECWLGIENALREALTPVPTGG